MVHEFILPIPAFSINSYYYATRKVITTEARAWQEKFLELMEEEKALLDMAALHRERGGEFTITITVQYPSHFYYNKQGEISSKTLDCSNTEKAILDRVLGDFMQVNDKFVTALHSYKGVGPCHQIKIRLELHPGTKA